MTPTRTRLLMLLIAGLAPVVARAAEPAPDADSDKSTPAATQDVSPPAGARDGKPSPDIFIPTEEISEDFAVSFPVDI